MTSKKHYVAIAREFAELLKEGNCPEVVMLAGRLACIFKDDNPAFDRDRFLQACGVRANLRNDAQQRGCLIQRENSCAEFRCISWPVPVWVPASIFQGRTNVIIGYARVSTDGQSLEAQQSALVAAGAERIFAEKESGAKSDRKQLAKAIDVLGADDVLLVTRLDRLARSTRDLLNVLATITSKAAGFRSIGDPMIDTSSPHGKLILAVLGALSEFERSMILARTDEGRRRAQARGVRFGRKPKLTPFQMAEALARRQAGEALAEIGRTYGVSHSTISRL